MADGIQGDPNNSEQISKKLTATETVSVVESIREDEYDFTSLTRGKCYIFNHKNFEKDTKLKPRDATDHDAVCLYCRFTELGFETDIFQDFTVREVIEKLNEAGKEDHSAYSSFVCCILSHGNCGVLYAKDGAYPIEDVFAPFRKDVCPSLEGKPKMFFFQACQGKTYDDGIEVVCREALDACSQEQVFNEADFLIVNSTIPGFYSWRNKLEGSWFIQALCASLSKFSHEKDLLQILTIVNRKVAFEYESCTRKARTNKKKEMPCIKSTLTRAVKFS